MTRGVILFVGPLFREAELLIARLEKENYQVVTRATVATGFNWWRKNSPQALLLSGRLSTTDATRCAAQVVQRPLEKRIPVIGITTDEAQSHESVKGVAETFRLHSLPVREAVGRLELAIQLTQLVKQKVS